MRFSSRTWSLLSILLFVAAVFFWLKGNEVRDRQRKAAPATAVVTNEGAKLELFSTGSVSGQLAQLGSGANLSPGQTTSSASGTPAKAHPYLLRNTTRPVDELVRDNRSILLVNAFIDTAVQQALEIPEHLRVEEPSSYIVQARGEVNSSFRKALENAGAQVVAYVPNNAYLVKTDGSAAETLRALPEVQAVLVFEPYFKIDRRLLERAVNEELLPDNASLRLTLFPGERENALNMLRAHVLEVIGEEPSPFGPQLVVRPQPDSLGAIARLGSVQAIEPDVARAPASDITRFTLGISSNAAAADNWLGLSGSNIWVNMNDVTVDTNHPALQGRVIAGHPDVSNTDTDGHGTFVAGLIVGDGSSAPAASEVQGSITGADFRGMAHKAKLLALPIESGVETHARVTDTYLTETAARSNYFTLKRTNSLISNNSWNYIGRADYDSAAARFDAATRDSIAGATGEQPVLYVFAAGNGGFGEEDGLGGTGGSIFSPGTAKNVLTVGALEHPRFITNFYTITNEVVDDDGSGTLFTNKVIETNYVFLGMTDSLDQVASFSSRGNVGAGVEGLYGRFKPDVVAPGTMLVSTRSSGWKVEDHFVVTNEPGMTFSNINKDLGEYRYDSGSTYAAATVSGMLALIQEFFEAKAPPAIRGPMSPALLKGLVINGSRSLTALYDFNPNAIINYQGWGLPGLRRTLPTNLTSTVEKKWPLRFVDQDATNALATGQSRTWNITLGTNTAFFPLRFTLVWTDPPGNPVVGVKLVNDLDLEVKNLDTGIIWRGNYIVSGSDFNQAIDPSDASTLALAVDRVNNVENIFINRPQDFGRRYSVTVRANRVNVNAVHDYVPTPARNNDIVQDFALVVSTDIGVDDPEEDEDIFEEFAIQPIVTTKYERILSLTNGLPLLNERIGANAVLLTSTNGITNQWNFYIFRNEDIPNSFATTKAGKNVAFVTFNPPNLASPARNVEADLDLYVSKNSSLTNLEPAVLESALKSVERGGSETIVLTDAVVGDVYYIGVKSEDQEGGEFSLMGVSSELPFEEDVNGKKVLRAVPISGVIPDGSAFQPGGNTMLAIGISQNRIMNTLVANRITHQDLGDLVGLLRHGPTQVVLNNHSLNDGNFGVTNGLFVYDDSPYSLPSLLTRPTDGPGSLNDFAGQKLNGAWILNMIDNAPGHTGRVEQMTIFIDPLQDTLIPGVVIEGSATDAMAVFPIDVPPGAVNLNVRVFDINGGALDAYLNKEALPTITNYVFRHHSPAGNTGFEFNYGTGDTPPLSAGTWFLGMRNPFGTARVNFKIIILFEFDFNSDNSKELNLAGPQIIDDATTNEVITILEDKVVTSAEVSLFLPHPRISDMALRLVSPQGTRVLLAENRGRETPSGFGATYVEKDISGVDITNYMYTVFTDDTNFARLPLKFGQSPFAAANFNPGVIYANGFEGAIPFTYMEGDTFDGWLVVSNEATVVQNPGLAHQGDKFLVLGAVANPGAKVALANATATFSQSYAGDFSVGRAINGTQTDNLGWGNAEAQGGANSDNTAVFETANDISIPGTTVLTFKLHFSHQSPQPFHTLGHFRLSVTTDPRTDFADGSATGGDVTANWQPLIPVSAVSEAGATMVVLQDGSILVSGTLRNDDVYTVSALTTLSGISGIRLEALEHSSLPFQGPGRQPSNGNYVVSEFEVFASGLPEGTGLPGRVAHTFPTEAGKEYELTFMAQRPGDDDIISWWKADGSASDSKDGNDGFLVDGATYSTGMVGRAFALDGIRSHVQVPHNSNLDMNHDFTIEFWVNPDQTQKAFANIMRKEINGAEDGYRIEMDGSPGSNRYFAGWKDGSGGNCWTQNSFLLAPNVWHHVAFTKVGNERRVYINGALQMSETCTASGGTVASTIAPLQFGAWTERPGREWKGLLDEVTFWSRPLSGPEVIAIYQAGSAGKCGLADAPQPCGTTGFLEAEGNFGNFSASPNWTQNTFRFVALTDDTKIQFWSETPNVWLDTFTLKETGNQAYLPEEPLELLNGERAMGDWSLELIDMRTGATNPLPALTRWKLNLTFAEPTPLARQLNLGFPISPLAFAPLYTNQVHYFYVDVCSNVTTATISLVGFNNVNGLELFMDRSGFPTGNSETDDYVMVRNSFDPPTSNNGSATLVLTTDSPASAPLQPGKRLYFALQNRSVSRTNFYNLRLNFDQRCAQPQFTMLESRQSVSGVLSMGFTGETEGELFRHEVTEASEPLILETSSEEGDIQIFVSKDVPPTRTSFTYSENQSSGGTERLVLSSTSAIPLEEGSYYILVVNNAPHPAVFELQATGGGGPMILDGSGFVNGRFTLSFTSTPGAEYEIQASADLVQWSTIETVTATAPETLFSAPAEVGEIRARFFRVLRK